MILEIQGASLMHFVIQSVMQHECNLMHRDCTLSYEIKRALMDDAQDSIDLDSVSTMFQQDLFVLRVINSCRTEKNSIIYFKY